MGLYGTESLNARHLTSTVSLNQARGIKLIDNKKGLRESTYDILVRGSGTCDRWSSCLGAVATGNLLCFVLQKPGSSCLKGR